jgi:hypothetical protein
MLQRRHCLCNYNYGSYIKRQSAEHRSGRFWVIFCFSVSVRRTLSPTCFSWDKTLSPTCFSWPRSINGYQIIYLHRRVQSPNNQTTFGVRSLLAWEKTWLFRRAFLVPRSWVILWKGSLYKCLCYGMFWTKFTCSTNFYTALLYNIVTNFPSNR